MDINGEGVVEMKRPKLKKDRMAYRDYLLEELYGVHIDAIINDPKISKEKQDKIAMHATVHREKKR